MSKKLNKNMHNLKYILLLLLSSQVVFISFAQNKEVDSILVKYNKCKVDSTKIDLLIAAADIYLNTDPANAIFYSKAALKTAQEIHDSIREQNALLTIGLGYEVIGDINNAFFYFNDCNKVAKKYNDIAGLAATNMSLGVLYSDLSNEQLALDYYTSALEFYTKSKNIKGICKCYINMSDALYHSNQSDKALDYLNKAKEISQKYDYNTLPYIYTNFGEVYFQKKDLKLAKEYATKGLTFSEKVNNLYLLSSNYLTLTNIYLAQNDLKNAEICVRKGFELAKETDIKDVLIDAYNLLSQVLNKQNRFEEALKYKTLFINTKDSVQSELNNNLLQAYETEKKDMELTVLKASEIQKDAELKKQHLISIVILITLFLVLFILGYTFYSRSKLRKVNQELEKANKNINIKQKEIVLQNNELKANNEKITQQSNHIEELNNIKDRLFAIISHDLRSPLNNLRKILNLLNTGKLTQERSESVFPMLDKSLNTVSNFLDNLLEWSKNQLKGEEIECIVFDMNSIVQSELELLENQAVEKQVVLVNQVPIGTNVFADKNMIDLVIRNFISNAIKFCLPNGKITIDSKQIAGAVEISVQDDGIGISPENITKIFQDKGKFTTLGTNNEMGTGLGLLLCKNFIEKLNGNIGVESKENEGSRFWFTLPMAKSSS